jgi:hypothetical protein
MEDCKYRLPCGICEKLSAPCEAPKECEHDWERINFTMTNDDIIFHSKCRKCNETKDEYMKQLFENISVSTGIKECEHKWESFIVIDQGGLRRRTEYRCSKCGALKT